MAMFLMSLLLGIVYCIFDFCGEFDLNYDCDTVDQTISVNITDNIAMITVTMM